MEILCSLIMRSARAAAVPAGGALAVDRDVFSRTVTAAIAGHPRIESRGAKSMDLPDGPAILATGPLTSPALHRALDELLGRIGALVF